MQGLLSCDESLIFGKTSGRPRHSKATTLDVATEGDVHIEDQDPEQIFDVNEAPVSGQLTPKVRTVMGAVGKYAGDGRRIWRLVDNVHPRGLPAMKCSRPPKSIGQIVDQSITICTNAVLRSCGISYQCAAGSDC